MIAHELMIKTNHYIIKGGELTDAQKATVTSKLLSARSDEYAKQRFYNGVNYPNNIDNNGSGRMYPEYFIPPYNNGKKLQTVLPMSPKTHIFSANSYELEIIRLLSMFAPDNPVVTDMVKGTLERLKTTCFGNGCKQGECFHSALPVLRFLAAAAPDETIWIKKLISFFNKHIDEKLLSKHIHSNSILYFWLCLSELPFTIAEPELIKYKNEYIERLQKKSCSMNNESGKLHNPVLYCVIRNCLCRFPEYSYIKNRQPYINEKDGRLYFDLNPV